MQNDEFSNILRKKNLKITNVRLRVLKILAESSIAMSHSDITRKLDDELIDKVTLYRTLNAFEECGLIHKVANEDRNWLYAMHLPDHHSHDTDHDHAHFVCDTCEKIYCFSIDSYLPHHMASTMNGFKIKETEIRLHGLCPTCQ